MDAIAIYSTELRRCFLIPIEEVDGGHGAHLRLDPTRNNQAQGVRWANDYGFEKVIRERWNQASAASTSGKLAREAAPGL